MLSKSTLKYIRSLRQAKSRQKYHKIVVEGTKSVHELLQLGIVHIDGLYALEPWIENNAPLLQKTGIEANVITGQELSMISAFTTPQHVIAVCEMPHSVLPAQDLPAQKLCLYLDGIRDPGNAGTIFRIADWFGISHIYLSSDTVDPYNPKVIQASMGSLFRISWSETVLPDVIETPGIHAFLTMPDGENIFTATLPETGLIILGNESAGVRIPHAYTQARRLSIPGDPGRGADSLNVAVSAGIICAEFYRQRSRANA